MSKLTDAQIRALLKASPKQRFDLRDAAVSGLMLRVGPGAAAWSLKFRIAGEGGISARGHNKKGKTYRVSLGAYPAVTLEAARGLAYTYLDQAAKGISPIVALSLAATAGGLTIKALSERFLSDYVRMKALRAVSRYEGALRVHVLPNIGDMLVDRMRREHVRDLLKKVMTRSPRGNGSWDRPRGGKEAARTVLSVLRKMISWGRSEELLKRPDNPASGMESNLPKKRQKDRVLSTNEARIVWQAAETLGYPFGPAYQLVMLTGCRTGEWARSLWPWIDFTTDLLVIPADRYKSDHVHVVPLVVRAIEILNSVQNNSRGRSGDYIFSGTDGAKPLTSWTKAQERMKHAVCAISGERVTIPWTPHDLRRTVATRIAEQLGVGGEQLIKRVLGHSDGSVTAIYNRYGYVKEMRAVLENWAAELTGRDGPSSVPLPPSVVPLRMVPAIRVVTGEAA